MIFDMKMGQNTPEELADKENIRELVEWERYCRDYEHWDQMRACYHDDATVCTSWTTANIDDFVEGSKKRASIPPRHKIFNTIVWLNGNRAVAECIAIIQIRCKLDGDLVDMTTHTRIHFRLEKREGVWKIFNMGGVYEKDMMHSAYANGKFTTTPEMLAPYRASYANMMYRQIRYGGNPNPDMIGEDRPETVEEMYRVSSEFLGV